MNLNTEKTHRIEFIYVGGGWKHLAFPKFKSATYEKTVMTIFNKPLFLGNLN